MKKGIVLCACALALTIGCIWGNTMMANEASQAAVGASLPKDHVFTTIDENGRLVEMDVEQMEEETAQEQEARKNMEGLQVGGVRDLKYGVGCRRSGQCERGRGAGCDGGLVCQLLSL